MTNQTNTTPDFEVGDRVRVQGKKGNDVGRISQMFPDSREALVGFRSILGVGGHCSTISYDRLTKID